MVGGEAEEHEGAEDVDRGDDAGGGGAGGGGDGDGAEEGEGCGASAVGPDVDVSVGGVVGGDDEGFDGGAFGACGEDDLRAARAEDARGDDAGGVGNDVEGDAGGDDDCRGADGLGERI